MVTYRQTHTDRYDHQNIAAPYWKKGAVIISNNASDVEMPVTTVV